MNEFQVFTKPVVGGFYGYIRTPKDGHAKPILGKGGKPILFPTELEAMRSVTTNLIRFINGRLYRSGSAVEKVAEAADAAFKPELRRKRKG